jgi:hypothetical protein
MFKLLFGDLVVVEPPIIGIGYNSNYFMEILVI